MLYWMVGSQTTSTARAPLSGAKKALKCPLMFEVEVQRQIRSSRHEKGGNSVTNHRYITFSLDEWTERIAPRKLSKYSMNPHLPSPSPGVGPITQRWEVCVYLFHSEKETLLPFPWQSLFKMFKISAAQIKRDCVAHCQRSWWSGCEKRRIQLKSWMHGLPAPSRS